MISSVSSAPVQQPQPVQSQAPGGKSQGPSQPVDTVHLSPQASASLKSGDVDHDGDSH